MNRRKSFTYITLYILAAVMLAWTLAPVIWMGITSVKASGGSFSMPPQFVFKPALDAYRFIFSRQGGFAFFVKNSAAASVLSTAVSLLLGSMGGYALTRGKFKKTKTLSCWILSARMAPVPAMVLSLHMIFARLGMAGTLPGLVFAYTTFNLPFALWMMLIFFKEVPVTIEEAARLDGCGKFQTFLHITLPAALPGLTATAALCLMFSWNDYIFALALSGGETRTLPAAAALLISRPGVNWAQAMAAGVVIVLPTLLCGLGARKYLVKGLSMGAVT
jgi:multiple sugar transport system permease protein